MISQQTILKQLKILERAFVIPRESDRSWEIKNLLKQGERLGIDRLTVAEQQAITEEVVNDMGGSKITC